MRVGRSPALLLMRERNAYTGCRGRRGMAACSPVLHSSRGLCLTMSAHTPRGSVRRGEARLVSAPHHSNTMGGKGMEGGPCARVCNASRREG